MEGKHLTADSPDSFTIFITCYGGKTFSVPVSLDDTVRDLKSKLNAQDSSLTPESGRLYYNETRMEDEHTLRHYQITPNCTLTRSLLSRAGDDGEDFVMEYLERVTKRLCPTEIEDFKFPEIDLKPQIRILGCILDPYSEAGMHLGCSSWLASRGDLLHDEAGLTTADRRLGQQEGARAGSTRKGDKLCSGCPLETLTEPLEMAQEDFEPQLQTLESLTKEDSEAGEEGTAAAAGSHLEETYYLENKGSRLRRRCQHCSQEDLPQVMPEITQDPLKHRTTYQAHVPGAGLFQCRLTGLGFKVKSAVTITYRYTSWTRHLSQADQELWVPAGPLFNIEAQPELVQAVYLPHFICLAEDVDTSLCSIAHFKSGIMTLERPTRLVAFSAVLENPSFSLLGVLWRKLRSALRSFPAHSLVLIFQQLSAANTTLHLYLIPDDNSVKQAIERQESNWNSKVIPKPSPFSPLFFGCDYWVTSNNSMEITPEPRLPLCYKSPKEQQPFLELYIKNMAEEMELRMMDKRDNTVVWRASLRSGDVHLPGRSSGTFPGAAFLKSYKTELCSRMSQISTILLHLREENVINSDEEEQVEVQSTSKRKNRLLLEMVEKKGVKAQEKLYQILLKTDPFLMEHLEMS